MSIRFFQTELLSWYAKDKRVLPWREESNPYFTWISEIMLQQTRVDTVIPYFTRFIKTLPSIKDLAQAEEDEVLKLWEGLGYYSRARNLHHAAKTIVQEHQGEMPRDPELLRKLKGIGPYTLGAVMSIAFNTPYPAVDGNVMRVMARYFLIELDIAKSSTRKEIERRVLELYPANHASDFCQALMELGALICTPKNPQCSICPVSKHCKAFQIDRVAELPIKTKIKAPKQEYRDTFLIFDSSGRILVQKRPNQGLLASMWELPNVEKGTICTLPGISFEIEVHWKEFSHIFTHIHWHLDVYICHAHQTLSVIEAPLRWIESFQIQQLVFPNVFLKILNTYIQKGGVEES